MRNWHAQGCSSNHKDFTTTGREDGKKKQTTKQEQTNKQTTSPNINTLLCLFQLCLTFIYQFSILHSPEALNSGFRRQHIDLCILITQLSNLNFFCLFLSFRLFGVMFVRGFAPWLQRLSTSDMGTE